MLSGFMRVPFMDLDTLTAVAKANPNVVAVMLEPVQGEGGLATADAAYLKGVRQLCDDHNYLMLLDEIQTGNGRTGSYFCYQQFGFLPDVVTTAKGLGNGVPIGACLARGAAAEILQPGNHGSTYGGNPLACAAGVAVVNTIVNEKLAEHAAHMGNYLRKAFTEQLAGNPLFSEIRGRGLMMGIVLKQDCPQLMAKALDKQLLLNVTSGNVIRLLPPLNLTEQEADQIIERVMALINELN